MHEVPMPVHPCCLRKQRPCRNLAGAQHAIPRVELECRALWLPGGVASSCTVQDAVDALTFMAEFCLRKRRLQDAEMYAMRLQDFGGPAKDKGRRVIDEVQRLKFQPDAAHNLGMHTDA